jgi:hypothetical protein
MLAPKEEIVYRFALDCAEHKVKGICKDRLNCARCASNVSVYVQDKQEAVMLQHMADLDMQKRWRAEMELKLLDREFDLSVINARRSFGVSMMVMLLMMVLAVVGAVIWTHPKSVSIAPTTIETKPSEVPWDQELRDWLDAHPETDVVTSDPIDPPSTEQYVRISADIIRTLSKIKSVDMDGDGNANCVDFVIQFWQMYPRKNEVDIVWNLHKPTDWNHLFVSIYGIHIECSAALDSRWPLFEIEDFWPSFNPLYNWYITEAMPEIIAGTYNWRRINGD